jgi:hypothetical protein
MRAIIGRGLAPGVAAKNRPYSGTLARPPGAERPGLPAPTGFA